MGYAKIGEVGAGKAQERHIFRVLRSALRFVLQVGAIALIWLSRSSKI